MSTFAVFGMTEHFAREEARKKTPTNVGKTQLTEAQWLEAVERRVERVMAGARVTQLSALFDAPQFAQQFIALLRKSGKARDLKIRARVKIKQPEAKGKRKAPSTEWKDVEAAQAICAQHYNFKSRSSCNACPLQPECHRPSETLTEASLNDWRERVNRLALPHGEAECRAAQKDLF